jgi:Tfp pilus assembly PilM family ATPase
MPELLAIDREKHRICGVLADVGSDSVRIRNTFSFDLPENLQDSPSELGAWLREELRKAGISARQAIVSLPREDVVVRYLDLPPATDDELPTLVRFQAAAKSTVSLDQLALDYVPLPAREGATGREVLVATVDQDRIRRLKTLGESAGVEVVSVGVSSISTAALVAVLEDEITHEPEDVSIIIARHGDRVEISLAGQRHLYSTQATQITPGQSEQSHNAILAEISRSMVALQKRLPVTRVMRCWLIGSNDEDDGLTDAVQRRFNCEVRKLDPFRTESITMRCRPPADSHGAYSGPVGLLLAQASERAEVVDFLNPRRPHEKVDYSKQKRLAVLVAGVLVVASVFGYRAWLVGDLELRTKAATESWNEQKERNAEIAPKVAVAEVVDEWDAKRVDWLSEANELAATMDGTERMYLTRLQFGEGLRGERGAITGNGQARERFDVESLNAQLVSRENTEVNATTIADNGRDTEYPESFELDVRLKVPKDDAKSK